MGDAPVDPLSEGDFFYDRDEGTQLLLSDLNLSQPVLEAFTLEQPEFDVLTILRYGKYYILAARERPNAVVSYWAPRAFVMKQTGSGWAVAGYVGCDPALSPGGESSVSFDTVDVTLVYGGGQNFTAVFARGGPLLFVLDGTAEVSDLLFSVDGEQVTGYQQIFGEAPEAFDQG